MTAHLGFEGVVLLAEVLLAVVVRVAAPVAPLEGVRRGHVDVLEVVISGVRAVGPRLGEGEAAVGAGRAVGGGPGHGVAGHGGHHTRERDLDTGHRHQQSRVQCHSRSAHSINNLASRISWCDSECETNNR